MDALPLELDGASARLSPQPLTKLSVLSASRDMGMGRWPLLCCRGASRFVEGDGVEVDVKLGTVLFEILNRGEASGGNVEWRCKYCSQEPTILVGCYNCNSRVKAHLLKISNQLDAIIARLFYSSGLSFNVSRNPYYQESYTFAASHNLDIFLQSSWIQ